ncbi:hypothetical protein BGX38DRAFT_1158116, partial [Terfezia claveryi]
MWCLRLSIVFIVTSSISSEPVVLCQIDILRRSVTLRRLILIFMQQFRAHGTAKPGARTDWARFSLNLTPSIKISGSNEFGAHTL